MNFVSQSIKRIRSIKVICYVLTFLLEWGGPDLCTVLVIKYCVSACSSLFFVLLHKAGFAETGRARTKCHKQTVWFSLQLDLSCFSSLLGASRAYGKRAKTRLAIVALPPCIQLIVNLACQSTKANKDLYACMCKHVCKALRFLSNPWHRRTTKACLVTTIFLSQLSLLYIRIYSYICKHTDTFARLLAQWLFELMGNQWQRLKHLSVWAFGKHFPSWSHEATWQLGNCGVGRETLATSFGIFHYETKNTHLHLYPHPNTHTHTHIHTHILTLSLALALSPSSSPPFPLPLALPLPPSLARSLARMLAPSLSLSLSLSSSYMRLRGPQMSILSLTIKRPTRAPTKTLASQSRHQGGMRSSFGSRWPYIIFSCIQYIGIGDLYVYMEKYSMIYAQMYTCIYKKK